MCCLAIDKLLTTTTDQIESWMSAYLCLEALSPSSSYEKLVLADSEPDLDVLNDSMKCRCRDELWRTRIKMAEGNSSLWQFDMPHERIGGCSDEKQRYWESNLKGADNIVMDLHRKPTWGNSPSLYKMTSSVFCTSMTVNESKPRRAYGR